MERETYVERVLIVLGPSGQPIAAQQERIQRITENGELITERYLGAEPLDPAVLDALIPEKAQLVAEVTTLKRDLDDMRRGPPDVQPGR